MLELDKMTVGEAKGLLEVVKAMNELANHGLYLEKVFPSLQHEHPWRLGDRYLIRTVTMFWIGELTHVYPNELVLKHASWIADTGRYSDCFMNGTKIFKEVEPVPEPVIINRGAIVDAVTWTLELPEKQK